MDVKRIDQRPPRPYVFPSPCEHALPGREAFVGIIFEIFIKRRSCCRRNIVKSKEEVYELLFISYSLKKIRKDPPGYLRAFYKKFHKKRSKFFFFCKRILSDTRSMIYEGRKKKKKIRRAWRKRRNRRKYRRGDSNGNIPLDIAEFS